MNAQRQQDAQRRYVVIMAGGGGTRLWPHSRRERPKQFLPMLPGGETLLGATVRRTLSLVPIEDTFVVTTAAQVPEVRRCLPDLPIGNILVEPIGRNTAPCIGLSALAVVQKSGGAPATMAVLPSDHYVKDEAAFTELLRQALSVADAGHVVTLGVRPTGPETGYGYIELDAASLAQGEKDGVHRAAAFVEKPSRERAVEYVAAGTYLWNSGMFFFPAQRILDELHRHLPPLGQLLDAIARDPGHTAALYPEAPAISIDYAVMEKLGVRRVGAEASIRVLAGDFGWNDVGSFAAASALSSPDEQGNHLLGDGAPPILVEARDNIVWGSGEVTVAALGVSGLVIAATGDAVLVMPQARAQDVREIVERLKKSGRDGLL